MKQDLFQYLGRKNTPGRDIIESEIKDAWYDARAYVKQKLFEWEGKEGINATSDRSLHFVVRGVTIRTLAVARQIALMAHYTNFKEQKSALSDFEPDYATHITFICEKGKLNEAKRLMEDEAFLGNLPRYCNEAYVDVKIHLQDNDDAIEGHSIEIREEDIPHVDDKEKVIDTFMARYVNMVYCIGTDIDNLPADDPNTASRYNLALDVFSTQKSDAERDKEWDNNLAPDATPDKVSQYVIRNVLSNVFCADCFESRMHGIVGLLSKEDRPDLAGRSITEYFTRLAKSGTRDSRHQIDHLTGKIKKTIAEHLECISRCEHSRWVVEKLIMGFEPFTADDHYKDAQLFEKDRTSYRDKLKKQHYRHIDICSYHDLRRLSPSHMKYDSFLMLAIPFILESYCKYAPPQA